MTDYIIVGAGSTGCILANRLSADPAVKVTLLEAGGPVSHLCYRMPAGDLRLMKSGKGNRNYDTVPQSRQAASFGRSSRPALNRLHFAVKSEMALQGHDTCYSTRRWNDVQFQLDEFQFDHVS